MFSKIKMRSSVAVLAAAASFGMAAEASAYVIDFEGENHFISGNGDFFDVDGMRFTQTSINQSFVTTTSQGDIIEANTTKLFAANHTGVTMSLAGGGAFDLLSLDLGGSFIVSPGRWADGISITATLLGGGTVQTTIDLPDALPDYVSAALGFSNITSVYFVADGSNGSGPNDYEFTMDNIVWDDASMGDVPLPAGLPLVLAGLGALGFAAKRRKG